MPSFRQLQYFAAVAERLHFHQAALELGTTQSNVSTQVKALETELGIALFVRDRKRVSLTPAGRAVWERARRILAEIEDLKRVAEEEGSGEGGTLRIGTLPTVGPYILPHVLPRLHERYPDLRIFVRETKLSVLITALETAELDALLVPLPLEMPHSVELPLYTEDLQVAMPEGHPLASHQVLTRADLAGSDVLALESGHRLFDEVRDICADYGARLRRDYEGSSLDTLRLMVATGMGLTFLPSTYVASEIRPGGGVLVRTVTGPGTTPQRRIALVTRHASPALPLCRALAKITAETLKELEIPGVALHARHTAIRAAE